MFHVFQGHDQEKSGIYINIVIPGMPADLVSHRSNIQCHFHFSFQVYVTQQNHTVLCSYYRDLTYCFINGIASL